MMRKNGSVKGGQRRQWLPGGKEQTARGAWIRKHLKSRPIGVNLNSCLMNSLFHDRRDAGKRLAAKLTQYASQPDVIVLGLPRGGVPVAYEVAVGLGVPLDLFVVRKLGVPGQEELAMGAIASGGIRVLNSGVIAAMHISADVIDQVAALELSELERREQAYRGGHPAPEVFGRTVILVDDGLATGATLRAACAALRRMEVRSIVAAVPVAASATVRAMRAEVDELVVVLTPDRFLSVGQWYSDFSQTTGAEVGELLRQANERWKQS